MAKVNNQSSTNIVSESQQKAIMKSKGSTCTSNNKNVEEVGLLD